MKKLKLELLLTGNELMTGDIIDSNSAMMAEQLLNIGVTIARKTTVADELIDLINEIQTISQQADVLIINGGLGPTVDDLTAEALAASANLPLCQHPEAKQHLIQWCNKRGTQLDQANLKQALLPQGVTLVPNDLGSAVGFSLELNNCIIFCTPGVPKELQHMMEQYIVVNIKALLPESSHYHVSRFLIFGIGESKLQQLISDNIPNWPQQVELGFRAASPLLELKLTIKNQQHQSILQQCIEQLKTLLGAHILCPIKDHIPTMAELVVQELSVQGKTITLAESCTGGLIASALTSIPGSSAVFEAGFVTYSNKMKSQMLSVSPETLQQFGAVSEQVVREMAQGALKKAEADYTIAVSGIAGPSGGSEEKPVGSVWLAWGDKSTIQTQYFCIKGNRLYFQQMVATRALDLIRRQLLGCTESPFYLPKTKQ